MIHKDGKGFSNKILNLDPRILWVILIVGFVYTLLSPLGLPIKIDKYTLDYYNFIESLPPGSIAVVQCDIESASYSAQLPIAQDLFQHLFNKKIKVIQIALHRADSQVNFERLMKTIDKGDAVYGEDWVNIGFVEGKETAMAAFAADLTWPQKDAYGNLLENLPLFKEAKTMNDIDLICSSAGDYWLSNLRQWSTPYGQKPMVVNSGGAQLPDVYPYYPTPVKGIMNGIIGAAQYEKLQQRPGLALALQDGLSFVGAFLIVIIVITNIVQISTRYKEGKKL